MTLRASEIGADTYSTNERKLDKNNITPEPNETEQRHEYPELSPGRALLDVRTGELIELMHRVNGFSEAVEGNRHSWQERNDYKYGTPKGQDWGGIIQHFYISVAKRQSPSPNHHGEIQVPINRPDESEITDLKPSAFRSHILTDTEGSPRPLVLLERPEVTYEEVIPGESYDVIGWYWPNADTPSERVKTVEELPHRFPDLAGIDSTTSATLKFDKLDLELSWDDVDTDSDVVRFAPSSEAVFDVDVEHSRDADFHISRNGASFAIDNPFDSNDDVKSINAWMEWNGELSAYTVDASAETLAEMIRTYTAKGWAFTVDADALETHATVHTQVVPDEYVELSIDEILEHTFSEEVTVGEKIDVPNSDITLDTTGVDSDIVAFHTTDDGDIVVEGVDEPNDNHIRGLVDGKLGIDAAKADKEYVKAIDWNDYRYGWDNSYGAWTVNADGLGPIIESYADADSTLTASLSVISQVANSETLTETRSMEIDQDDASGLSYYTPGAFRDVFDYDEHEMDITTDSDAFVHGMGVTDDNLSLLTLDLTIADTGSNDGLNVSMSTELDAVPDGVQSMWEPATAKETTDIEDAETYAWWNAETGDRVEVIPVEGWGTEYAVYVEDNGSREHVVTLADEQMAAQTVLTHLKAMGR